MIVLKVPLNPDERALLDAIAEREHLPLAAVIRRWIYQNSRRSRVAA